MQTDQLQLPPVIATRRFLRQQQARKLRFRSWIDEVYERDWKARRPRGPALADFAQAVESELSASGAFQLDRRGSPDTLRLKPYEIHGNVLWPVGLAQFPVDGSAPYVEQAVMLARTGARISATKTVVHEASLCFGYTRHVLERLCERGGFEGDLEEALTASCIDTMKLLALALSFGIFVEEGIDEAWRCAAFVPFGEGLLIFSNRLMVARPGSEYLGWRCSFSKRRYSEVYVKKGLILSRSDTGTLVSGWLATTFVQGKQLSQAQRKYVAAFKRFREGVGVKNFETAHLYWFDPEYERNLTDADGLYVDGELQQAFESIQAELGVSLKAKVRDPAAYFVEWDTT